MPENPVLLPLRGFNELETPRPCKQVSPLGTLNTFRAGPLGRRFEARREPTTCWKGAPTAGCG
ncbi:hypothetical protein SBC2_85210 (plasmid) [Caballeronia sp. SBC2]|nr:hypothetical protein SBC2_85210 [Caballeronia sp. SBC2]